MLIELYGTNKTITDIPFKKTMATTEPGCIAKCLQTTNCLSLEILQKTEKDFECRLFRVYYEKSMKLISKVGAKYYSKLPHHCLHLFNSGQKNNGVYTVKILGLYLKQVYCNMEKNGGGWMVFQRRFDGSVSFNRTWDDYKYGFGNAHGEYWLGNKWLHLLTSSSYNDLFVYVVSFKGAFQQKKFHGFTIASEKDSYRFDYKNVSTWFSAHSLFDSMKGLPFSTRDKNNQDTSHTTNCAKKFGGGWWYRKCHDDLMNGIYADKEYNAGSYPEPQGIVWKNWSGPRTSLKKSTLYIRPIT